MTTDAAHRAPTVRHGQNSRAKRVAESLALPIVYVINRPALAAFCRAAYDIALRLNGIAIAFKGLHGLTPSEERLLQRHVEASEAGVLIDVVANEGIHAKRLRAQGPSRASLHSRRTSPRSVN